MLLLAAAVFAKTIDAYRNVYSYIEKSGCANKADMTRKNFILCVDIQKKGCIISFVALERGNHSERGNATKQDNSGNYTISRAN